MKVKFADDRISDYKARAGLILADEFISDTQKKQQINALRLEVMRKYSFYSPERESIDHYIRTTIDKRNMREWKERQQSATSA